MTHTPSPATRVRRALTAVLSVLVASVIGVTPATAANEPPSTYAPTVTADALPTVQIDGVAWTQLVVGNVVYVGGEFTTARPAGAAAGVNTTSRTNLLAYDIRTGELITSWAPRTNAPVYALAASPDGSRIYIGGNFTTVNGSSRTRLAAVGSVGSASSGALVGSFAASPNAAVRGIAVSATRIFIGGNFNTVGGQTRYRLASFVASSGALESWRASVQSAQVDSIVLAPDGTKLILAGRFEKINEVANPGMGAVSVSTGQVLPWPANKVIVVRGYSAGVTSITTDGTLVYGTTFGYLTANDGSVANLEGAFAIEPTTGSIRWVEDCQGDHYSVFPNPGGDTVYVAGHPHNCQNVAGFPEESPRVHRYGLGFSKDVRGVITNNTYLNYNSWEGTPRPQLRNWFPDFVPGTFTGQNQAGWSVTGTSEYLAYGGEFRSVNGVAQQGLVRFAVPGKATNAQGPRLSGSSMTPTARSLAAGTVELSWPSNWDRDDDILTYRVLRNGTQVASILRYSSYWERARIAHTVTGLANNTSYSFQVQAVDSANNTVTSGSVSVRTASSGSQSEYATRVLQDNPSGYWRLGDSSGSMTNWTGHTDAGAGSGVARSQAGAIAGDSDTAAGFNGSSSSRVWAQAQDYTQGRWAPNRFSIEAWFKTTSTAGGRIVGLGSSSSSSDGTSYDRHIYLSSNGRLNFGVYPGNRYKVITSPSSYNDGAWHQVVASCGPAGLKLYVDGALVASDPNVSSAQLVNGFWRIGGGSVSGWPNASGSGFVGTIDDVSVYGYELPAADVAAHNSLARSGAVTNAPPSASFTATGGVLSASFDGRASTDPDGTIESWAWQFGDGATGTGATTSHTYAAADTYTVTLTVTDDDGATATTTRTVTVTEPAAEPVTVGADTFERAVSSGLGTADVGGAWTASATTSVAGGAAVLPLASANALLSARLPGASAGSTVTAVTTWLDKRPNGTGVVTLVRGRIVSSAGEYRLKTFYRADGSVAAALVRSNAAGTETVITATTAITGLTFNAGTKVRSLLEVSGASPTTVRAKVWADGSTEPSTWLLTVTDSTSGLQTAGHVGLAGLALSTTTNGPTVLFDDLSVVAP